MSGALVVPSALPYLLQKRAMPEFERSFERDRPIVGRPPRLPSREPRQHPGPDSTRLWVVTGGPVSSPGSLRRAWPWWRLLRCAELGRSHHPSDPRSDSRQPCSRRARAAIRRWGEMGYFPVLWDYRVGSLFGADFSMWPDIVSGSHCRTLCATTSFPVSPACGHRAGSPSWSRWPLRCWRGWGSTPSGAGIHGSVPPSWWARCSRAGALAW